jgi:hypothetical protein
MLCVVKSASLSFCCDSALDTSHVFPITCGTGTAIITSMIHARTHARHLADDAPAGLAQCRWTTWHCMLPLGFPPPHLVTHSSMPFFSPSLPCGGACGGGLQIRPPTECSCKGLGVNRRPRGGVFFCAFACIGLASSAGSVASRFHLCW